MESKLEWATRLCDQSVRQGSMDHLSVEALRSIAVSNLIIVDLLTRISEQLDEGN